ncbi:hypothetical protein AGMMS49960_21910 [Betaproteobacteria bacterium]|nr:hypothetical protein AGMMS49960_21910 [Betaproteobacteria bacterium]
MTVHHCEHISSLQGPHLHYEIRVGGVLEKAVKGMLPKGPLGYAMLKKLKCYAGNAHPHTAQQPKVLVLDNG